MSSGITALHTVSNQSCAPGLTPGSQGNRSLGPSQTRRSAWLANSGPAPGRNGAREVRTMKLYACENCKVVMGQEGPCDKCKAGGNRPREEGGNIFFTTSVSGKYEAPHWIEHRATKVQDAVRASNARAGTITIVASGITSGVDIECHGVPGGSVPLTARAQVHLSVPKRHGELPVAHFVKWVEEAKDWAKEQPALRLP